MAKTQLLCSIVFIILWIGFGEVAYSISEQEIDHILDQEKHRPNDDICCKKQVKFTEPDFSAESLVTDKDVPELIVFVSSTMPIEILKQYAQEAHKYSAKLVFRGVPDGSFMQFVELVHNIYDEEFPVAIQIDNLAFEYYEVTSVPTIVLSEISHYSNKERPKFDKISGVVRIKYAIEKFSENGVMSNYARDLRL